jgi:hypothetical protein
MHRWLSLVLACVVSFSVAFGSPARRHSADSLIPVFVSLEHWTPFYWGQDRFGMLLALIAVPVRDGLWNLLVQNMLSAGLLFLGIVAMQRRTDAGVPALVATTTLGLLLIWPAPQVQRLLLTTDQSYAPALGLAGMACALLRRSETPLHIGAVVLLCLSSWLNAGVALLASCVSLAAMGVAETRVFGLRLLGGAMAGIGFHGILQQGATDLVDVTQITVRNTGQIVPLLAHFWTSTITSIFGIGVWIVVVIWAIATYMASETERRVLSVVLVGSVLYGSVMAVLLSGLERHGSPLLPLLLVSGLSVVAKASCVARFAPMGAIAAALAVALVAEPRAPGALRRSLLASLGGDSVPVALSYNVSIVTGDYWRVWPVTFALRYLVPPRMLSEPVTPVALRADAMTRARAGQFRSGAVVLVIPHENLSWWSRVPGVPALERVPGTTYDIRTLP